MWKCSKIGGEIRICLHWREKSCNVKKEDEIWERLGIKDEIWERLGIGVILNRMLCLLDESFRIGTYFRKFCRIFGK